MAGYLPPIGGILEGQAQATRIWFKSRVVGDHGLLMLSCDQSRERGDQEREREKRGERHGGRGAKGEIQEEGGARRGFNLGVFLCS